MPCPFCQNINVEYYDRGITVPQIDHLDVLPEKYLLYRCKMCSLIFKDYIPSDTKLQEFYNTLSENSWNYKIEYPHEKYLKEIISTLPLGSKILDLGCNIGRLLETFTTKYKCYGIEANLKAARLAEEKGIIIISNWINFKKYSEGPFDLILMVDIFEHLTDPLPTLNTIIQNNLSQSGVLLIFTGRTDCFPVWLTRSFFLYFRYSQHLIFANSVFIMNLPKFIDNVKVSYVPMNHFYYNIKSLFYQLSWHIVWRLFSPHSPYAIIQLKKYSKLKEPFQMTCWKDHVLIKIRKT